MRLTATLLPLALIAALTSACGGDANPLRKSSDKGNADAKAQNAETGIYHVGDTVRYEVTRTGYKSLEKFYQTAEVISIDGTRVFTRWTDTLDAEGTSLISWDDGSRNPDVLEFDYNGPEQPYANAMTYAYEAEAKTTRETPVGSFECVSQKYQVTEKSPTATSSYTIERCKSPLVAVTQNVTFAKNYLDAAGNITKSYKKTLLDNRKH